LHNIYLKTQALIILKADNNLEQKRSSLLF